MKNKKPKKIMTEKKAMTLLKKGKIYLDLGIIFTDEFDYVLIPICNSEEPSKKSYFKTTSDFLLKLYDILH